MKLRNLYLYWTGKEYTLISILRNFIHLHSKNGIGYHVHFINENNITEYIQDIPPYFNKLCPAHQADFVRVNVICENGGIWLDSDTLVIDTLDTLFDKIEKKDGFFIKENNEIIWNGIFGSKKQTRLMLTWKRELRECLDEKHEHISWCEIGNDMLQKLYNKDKSIYDGYEILNGLDNMYPVNWNNCVTEYIYKPYENYKSIIRTYQPLIVLVNSVYKVLENKTEKEIIDGNMPLNYFMKKSTENSIKIYNIKKYIVITDWIKNYITLEPYTFATNLIQLGWIMISVDYVESIKDKCILLCITYDDYDISKFKKDNIFLIYKIDDVYPYKTIRETCIHHADLIISPYQYLLDTDEIRQLYHTVNVPSIHIPYSAVNEFYQPCIFNNNPILKIFVSGCDIPSMYPFRHFIKSNPLFLPYIEKLEHPSYNSYTHNHINKNYYKTLNNYLCCFTDATNYNYVLLKVFEICSVGSLLLVADTIKDELNKLGFYDNTNCIMCNEKNLENKIKIIMNKKNRIQIDKIRLMGMELVHNQHNTFRRSIDFNCKIENLMINIMDKIGFSNKEIFETIYKKKIWNNNDDSVPLSGPGSSLENTKDCSELINQFIYNHGCSSVLDIGCGDLTWVSQCPFFKDTSIEYTGLDVVEPFIQSHSSKYNKKFICEDITSYVLSEQYSLIIIRDVLFHLKNNEILSIFENIKHKFSYIIITSCKNKTNHDLFDQWRFSEKNIHIEPFNRTQLYECTLEEEQFNRGLYLYTHSKFYGE